MTRRVWFLLVTVSLVFVAVPQETGPQFVSLDQARPVLEAFRKELPDELKTRTAGDLKAYWPSWVAKRDREVRARLDQGEEDTITNLLRFGVTYTQQPRIDWPSLFKYGQSVGVDFWVQNRVDDLVSALTKPGKREHLLAARAFLEKRGFAFTTPAERAKAKEALLANLVRMQKEFAGYQEQLRALRAANKLSEAKMLELDSHLFEKRGISLDTSIRPNFALQEALRDLVARKVFSLGSIRRVAVIGPGLDFVNKEEGVDFYPTQTIQPFAVIDSLLKLRLSNSTTLQVVTYDISPSVNHHIERARVRAAKGLPYQLQIPWDATKTWSPEFTSYWETFGSRIGKPARALPVPEATPELKMRALDIRSKTVQIVRPTDMNVVFQQDVISDENKFDLMIGTNVFVYYGGFEQALALRNLAGMMRSGGILLSNNFLQIFPGSLFKEAGRTIAPISNAEAETIFFYRRD